MPNELIFSHEGNARAAASLILVGVIAALIGSVFMAIGPKAAPAPRPAVDAATDAPSAPVRIVGQVPHENVPCDQQVWPNIEQRCLVRKEVTPKSENTPSPAPPPGSAAPTARRQESLGLAESSDKAVTPYYAVPPYYDDPDEVRQQENMDPPPRKRQRRHHRSFHSHFAVFPF